jgi:hypothetical protein
MRLQQQESSFIYATPPEESIPFTIGDTSVIIDIVRNKLYSYPIRTLVQEYLSNAADACREIGKCSSNIEVNLPTNNSPILRIRDHGIGMSEDRVKEVFVKYGVSTKRESNSQHGYFGIGAKSGWSYTDTFTVETYYEGGVNRYIASIGNKNQGELILLSQEATTETNGVALQIPVKTSDISNFEKAYIRATCFWKQRPRTQINPTYPQKILECGDVTIFKNPNQSPFNDTLYINAKGIPFEIYQPSGSTSKELDDAWQDLIGTCKRENILIAIKANPAKLGISANRENFSNKEYAYKKVLTAYGQIINYIHDCFEKTPFAEYVNLCKQIRYLLQLKHNYFSEKIFKITPIEFWGDKIKLKVKIPLPENGYFYRLKYRSTVEKSIIDEVVLGDSVEEIFISKSKGAMKTFEAVPGKSTLALDITPETEEAMAIVKRHFLLHNKSKKDIYVFFSRELIPDMYANLAGLVGAVRYIEDAANDIKKLKIKKEPAIKREKEVVDDNNVRLQEVLYNYKTQKATRSYTMSLKRILDKADLIFYGATFDTSFVRVVEDFTTIKISFVYTTKTHAQYLISKKHPKLHPIADAIHVLKQNPLFMSEALDKYALTENRRCTNILRKYGKEIQSQKIDMGLLTKRLAQLVLTPHASTSIKTTLYENIFGPLTQTSIFQKFADMYPLINLLREDEVNQLNIHLINSYISMIDQK